jgi:type II secretory pathway pseudopilin PulG
MNKRYAVLGLSLFLALALAVPALGGPSNPIASVSASVKSTANKALKKAKAAQKTANTALSTANSAQSTASGLQTDVKGLQTDVKGLQTDVKKAQTTANEGKTAAATAQSAANAAKAAADAADANANTRLKTSVLALGTPSENDNTAEKSASVTCPAGTVILGGGAFVNAGEPKKVHLVTSQPQAIYSQGWFVEAATNEGQTATWAITAQAMCGQK